MAETETVEVIADTAPPKEHEGATQIFSKDEDTETQIFEKSCAPIAPPGCSRGFLQLVSRDS